MYHNQCKANGTKFQFKCYHQQLPFSLKKQVGTKSIINKINNKQLTAQQKRLTVFFVTKNQIGDEIMYYHSRDAPAYKLK